MVRTVIATLPACDAATQSSAGLAPGAEISAYMIRRHTRAEIEAGGEPYTVRFESGGREYWCALPVFQSRTVPVEETGAAGAVAV